MNLSHLRLKYFTKILVKPILNLGSLTDSQPLFEH